MLLFRFFGPVDCFASDLVNITPLSSTDTFLCTAMLSSNVISQGEQRVPYVGLVVWNGVSCHYMI